MIDVREAVQFAQSYLKQLYPNQLLRGVLLEEVEPSDDDQFWYVTLGWDLDMLGARRIYKVFKIRSDTGEVISMKMRTLQ